MVNRKRNIRINFYVDENEMEVIRDKMKKSNVNNLSTYARKMLIDGYVIHVDYQETKAIYHEVATAVNKVGTNINQISRRVNETSNIYTEDIKEIKKSMEEIWRLLKSSLLNLHHT